MDRTANDNAAPITLDRLRKVYPDQTVSVDELTFDVKAGDLAVPIGPSGCGKSTVLPTINRLIEPRASCSAATTSPPVDPVRLTTTWSRRSPPS